MEPRYGVSGYNATKNLPVLSIWAFIGLSFWKGKGRVSIYRWFGQFSIIESSGEDNSASLCKCVLYCLCCIFSCCILSVILKAFHSLIQLLLISVWQIFDQTLEKKRFFWVWQLRLIHYLVILLCLFWNYLIVRKSNCLLLSLMLLLII